MNQLYYDLFYVYEKAKKGKRNTKQVLQFEMNFESLLIELGRSLSDYSYKPWVSTCFIHTDRVKREVFAAEFRDRIVHHLWYYYVYKLFDEIFIYDSYSCRVEKGTLLGIKRVDHFIRSCSDNYSNPCWLLKLDIKSFFTSIDKTVLESQIRSTLILYSYKLQCDLDRLLWLTHTLIWHDPTQNYIFYGKKSDYNDLPLLKSLFSAGIGKGLPIGNLTSQLFANIYMNQFDQWIKHTMKVKYYGRYVDDFVIVHSSKDYLLNMIPSMRSYLSDQLGLLLHPHKIYLQHMSKGVQFCGTMILPYRRYVLRRTIKKWSHKLRTFPFDQGNLSQFVAMMNSYFGMVLHHDHYDFANYQRIISKTLYPHISYKNGFVQQPSIIQDYIGSHPDAFPNY